MHDVIIIGGGPAGATAATFLAKAGKTALVLEKDRFPRFHVGESLLPYNHEIFDELGIGEAMKNAGWMLKRAAQFCAGQGKPGARLVFANGIFTEHPEAFQVERSRFDLMLLNHARDAGATVREGCAVLRHRIEGDHAAVVFRDENGAEHETKARFLLDASGMTAFTGMQEGIRHIHPQHRKVAVFGHFSDVVMPECEEEGDIVLVVLPRSWCWLIPLSKTKVSVGLVLDRAQFAGGPKPEALFDQIVRDTPELWRRMSGAKKLTPLHIIPDYSFRVERMVSPRLIRIGDAAGFLDPIFSSGVMLAMQMARDGARCAIEALATGEALTENMRRYETQTRATMERFWKFIENYYTVPFRDLFLQPYPRLQMTSAINAILAGRPDVPWRVRWRLWVFFAMVRLQRVFPICPRIQWPESREELRENAAAV